MVSIPVHCSQTYVCRGKQLKDKERKKDRESERGEKREREGPRKKTGEYMLTNIWECVYTQACVCICVHVCPIIIHAVQTWQLPFTIIPFRSIKSTSFPTQRGLAYLCAAIVQDHKSWLFVFNLMESFVFVRINVFSLYVDPKLTSKNFSQKTKHTALLRSSSFSAKGGEDWQYPVPTLLDPGQFPRTLQILFWCWPLWLVGYTL